jgi:hypothetical protein
MASRQQTTDLLGTHLLAAELTRRGFLVAPATRNDSGADLFVTNQRLSSAWTIQVKTNDKRKHSWSLREDFRRVQSDTHVYVFVKLNGEQRPDYYIVSSRQVARDAIEREKHTRTSWRSYPLSRASMYQENWALFGEPHIGVLTGPSSRRAQFQTQMRPRNQAPATAF